jgi:hypothetical protein
MPLHYTDDPTEQAADIARREAKAIWKNGEGFLAWGTAYANTYMQVLREMEPDHNGTPSNNSG